LKKGLQMPVIRIDDEVLTELKRLAVVYGLVFKPPNAVLRRALGLDKPTTNVEEAGNTK